jgi:hypothetical protein
MIHSSLTFEIVEGDRCAFFVAASDDGDFECRGFFASEFCDVVHMYIVIVLVFPVRWKVPKGHVAAGMAARRRVAWSVISRRWAGRIARLHDRARVLAEHGCVTQEEVPVGGSEPLRPGCGAYRGNAAWRSRTSPYELCATKRDCFPRRLPPSTPHRTSGRNRRRQRSPDSTDRRAPTPGDGDGLGDESSTLQKATQHPDGFLV